MSHFHDFDLASAVSTYMQDSDVVSVGKGAKMQNHPNIAGSLAESLWSVLFDAHLSWDHKCEMFAAIVERAEPAEKAPIGAIGRPRIIERHLT